VNKAIAYVEDDDLIRENYAELLSESGFEVTTYSNPKDALAAFSQKMPNLVLLDITLGRERDAGFQLCSDIRKLSSTVQIVFLTSHDGEIDKISGLRLGADDYITKDVSIDYIVVRLEALFRRLESLGVRSEEPAATKASLQPESEPGDIVLDHPRSQVSWKGLDVDLPLTQYWIVECLASEPGQVKSHRQLMHAANILVESNTIVAHVKSIRAEFMKLDPEFDQIRTERGRGYRWII
jgi:two-component system OmpR family response regulator